MIKVTLYQNEGHIYRVCFKGHAGYAKCGEDIVCASVSALTINTLNAIETFTCEPFKELGINQEEGYIDVVYTDREAGKYAPEAELLLNTMVLGLESIKNTYGEKYIQIKIQNK